MEVARPEFRPDAAASREEMEATQREIAASAVFEDRFDFDPARAGRPEGPLVAGVDQAFLDDRVVSVVVVLRGDTVVERARSVSPTAFPYVPGLLSFREGGPILDAFEALDTRPDLVLFDGSGRIHFRQAGLATHMGVALDVPAVGVAKSLLCGRPVAPTDELAEGARVAVEANGRVDAPNGTVIGYAVQTRQFDSYRINPLYVSPGHRVSAETAADVALACRGGYKLPEPTRLADQYADEVKRSLGD
ncbi:endonuclease V [Halomarina halobia]|uniref:Endonuclease V n=1 Tax=Halomarina halobia TaxID=3033386 RepID=A0ABD6ABU1_9EURY|nr:endonuclease V [Halomarina sp. PSR21]